VNYEYDARNRLVRVVDNRLAGLSGGVTTYTYDDAGNLASYVYPNGVVTTHAHNALNRLTSLTIAGTAPIASFTYTLGAAGNRLSVAELGGRRVDYAYDALYRLTGETIAGGATPGNNGTIAYTYDPVGNRLNRTSTVAPIPTTAYAYDANDRLLSDTYDANGNTTAAGGRTFGYEFENRLMDADGGAVTMVYDGDGNRVAKTVSGVTTRYLVDDRNGTRLPQVMEEVVGDKAERVYVYGVTRISRTDGSQTSILCIRWPD
jgi:YD repeat-containing protein